jgi:hypothetical protein
MWMKRKGTRIGTLNVSNCQHAMNTAISTALRATPYFIVHGMRPNMPYNPRIASEDSTTGRFDSWAEFFRVVQDRQKEAFEKYAKYHNQKAKERNLPLGCRLFATPTCRIIKSKNATALPRPLSCGKTPKSRQLRSCVRVHWKNV